MKNATKRSVGAFRVALLLTCASLTLIGTSRAVCAQTATPTPTPAWTQSGVNISNANSGNVGIGTASPAQLLHINSASTGRGVLFSNTATAAGTNIPLQFQFDVGPTAEIRAVKPNAGSGFGSAINADLSFRVWDVGTAGYWSDALYIKSTGNVGIGTTSPRGKFEVAGGSIYLGDMGQPEWGNMIMRGRVFSSTGNIHLSPPGGATVYINSYYREAGGTTGPVNLDVSGTITGGNIQAKYQDVAEWVPSTQKLLGGTVVILDPDRSNQVIASSEPYDTRVAGVISDQPGMLLGEGGDGKVKVATTGRVKVRVDASRGPIHIGDLLVTSDREGVAMKSEPIVTQGRKIHTPGSIIGKALESLEKGTGEILILLSLQ